MKGLIKRIYGELIKKAYIEPCIVLYGDRRVFIENISRVYEIDECCVSVGTLIGNISVFGQSLVTQSCTQNSLNIYGRITSCEIERRNYFDL